MHLGLGRVEGSGGLGRQMGGVVQAGGDKNPSGPARVPEDNHWVECDQLPGDGGSDDGGGRGEGVVGISGVSSVLVVLGHRRATEIASAGGIPLHYKWAQE